MSHISAKVKAVFVALAMSVGSATQAGSVWCTGTVVELGVHLPNQLLVRLSSMNERVVVCFLDATYSAAGQLGGSTSATTCKGMYANLLAARSLGQNVQMMMDGDQVPAQCSNFAGWSYVSLRYVANVQ
jgi:hypothetical protein